MTEIETSLRIEEIDQDKEEDLHKVMPLYLELSSSLNVELVYIILKSITQFAYVKASTREGDDPVQYSGKQKKATNIEVD